MQAATNPEIGTSAWEQPTAYEQWITTLGIPIHRGYYVGDLRTIELGWWEARQCNAAILVLAGQEGVSEVRVTEIPAGQSTRHVRVAADEIVYVLEGRGLTSVWADGGSRRTFEWQKHSLFLLPRHHFHQLSSVQGDRPARLLHYSCLPLAMMTIPDPEFFFDRPYARLDSGASSPYSEAKLVHDPKARGRTTFWSGNFFPDMRAWDKMLFHEHRGAGGQVVWIQYPDSPLWNHMSVFPDRTYKKGHAHGPGTLIVIVEGEGYSYMWEAGKEKVHVPWHEASVTVPPDGWYHQHFNLGAVPARYLAFHSPRSQEYDQTGRRQIEYADEDPIVRKTFEEELAKRGLRSIMPEQVYVDRNYKWRDTRGSD